MTYDKCGTPTKLRDQEAIGVANMIEYILFHEVNGYDGLADDPRTCLKNDWRKWMRMNKPKSNTNTLPNSSTGLTLAATRVIIKE